MRVNLFEFEDFSWFPDVIRSGGTDFLRYFLIQSELYKPTVPLIEETLTKINQYKIIDLCSGGGGAIEQLYKELNNKSKQKISITLTDKFPNIKAFQFLKIKTKCGINYLDTSIDAMDVPKDLKGFRTMFSAVHHFQPDQVKKILRNAVENREGLGLFDGGDKSIIAFLGILIIHPIAFLIFTPFFKPFNFSRLFYTYLIPLIPIYTIWDGLVSILRMYQPEELMKLAESLNSDDYVWICGKTKNRYGLRATYLIGYPKSDN